MWWRSLRLVIVSLALVGGGVIAFERVGRDLATPRSLVDTSYVGSTACRHCHPAHAESFARTFHRTMTQDASEQSVLGAFDQRATLDYGGVRAHMSRGARGEFLMTFSAAGGTQRWQAEVTRTVGSHRFQQYLARDQDVFFRLPVAWDVAEQRFIHMNGAFLTSDPIAPPGGGSISRADYDRHVTRWNDNCVFCHNTQPNPGLDPVAGTFDTRVAELGIACEACHGPGAEHVARNQNPLRRYALQVLDRPDPSIRNPARMSAARSSEVCGRCHGQRITSDVGRFLRDGDRFVPGDPLAAQSRPLWRDTPLDGKPGEFAARFWKDGTARLTAYEYQGHLQSPCARGGKLSCESCHAMHQGDPRGQIHPERVGDAACTSCHDELASELAAAAHSRHSAGRSGVRCTSCHMPDIVYGLVAVKLSHRIEVPDPAAQAVAERPDACTLCHVDRDRAWAIDARARLFDQASSAAAESGEGLSWVGSQLLSGDPIERAVAAHALGRASVHEAAAHEPHALFMLADTLRSDRYPAVRAIALRSLRARLERSQREALGLLAGYVATDAEPERSAVVARLLAELGTSAREYPPLEARQRLRAMAEQVAIEIGE